MLRGCAVFAGVIVLIAVCGASVFLLNRYMRKDSTPISVPDAKPISCAEVLPFVTENLTEKCSQFPGGYNTACYGNSLLTVRFQDPAADTSIFDERGEVAALDTFASLRTDPYNPSTHEWGIGVLRLRALLEGTVAGEVVTMVLYGQTDMEPDSAHTPEGSAAVATLSKFPAFYFSTRAGTARDCNGLPDGGILIDTPDGIHVTFVANEVTITLASTAILQNGGGQMLVTILDGQGEVTVGPDTVLLGTMQEVAIDMDSTGRRPLRFAGSAVFANPVTLGLPAICRISGALGLTFACNVPPATAVPAVVMAITETPTPTFLPTWTPLPPPTFRPLPTSTFAPTLTPIPTATPYVRVCTGVVNTGRLGLPAYDRPDGNQIGTFKPGETVTIAETLNGPTGRTCPSARWYRIEQPYSAWVCSNYVAPGPDCGPLGQGGTTGNTTPQQPSFSVDYTSYPAPLGNDPDGGTYLARNTIATFGATDWIDICAVRWLIRVDGNRWDPVDTNIPPFSFTYTFDAGTYVDITALPYLCSIGSYIDELARSFSFIVEETTSFAASYKLDQETYGRDESGRTLLGYYTSGYFYADNATNVCGVTWTVWLNGSFWEEYYVDSEPFGFDYLFDTPGGLVDIEGLPYDCSTSNPVYEQSASFSFRVNDVELN